ncbi:hypothetical protein B0T26DRAFT_750945 [Lasiosphaeria miniovina]|uniref:Uncharacterized protein n=1 Tax=Lasiosphaeria miniovina TaxID=1954250 RepID=A0AA40AJ62_9PEZI|nr:uncharacterized protein B0T26DRAFT_750945 [Lasiosphaeria miniovina]KAK0716799.1 hypothetical protein B0T26DRAFT_750945 [Lasiosphaeria miniovina]
MPVVYARPFRRERPRWPKEYHRTGSGTYGDPWVIWGVPHDVLDHLTGGDDDLKEAMIQGTNRVCRAEAIAQGFRCIVVRGSAHATYTVRHTKTRAITGHHRGVDDKVTVFMGNSWSACQTEGHVYVLADTRGVPLGRLRSPGDRVLVAPNCKPCVSEYWLMKAVCERPSSSPNACPRRKR